MPNAIVCGEELTLYPERPGFQEQLLTLPEVGGVYAIRRAESALHLSRTTNLRRRLLRLLNPDHTAGAKLREQMIAQSAFIEYCPLGSTLEIQLHLYALALRYFPDDYLRRLRLRLPWFVSMTGDDYPRLAVSSRGPASETLALGPFPNRDSAVKYEDSALQLFQIRRCTETLQPYPEHPGCIYGEMNLCLRPCQQRVSKDEYASEVKRLEHFVKTGAIGSVASLTLARERAAADLDFEWAAQLHREIQRVSAAAEARPDIVAVIDAFNGIALEPGSTADTCILRPMWEAHWRDPIYFPLVDEENRTVSLDRRLKDVLENSSCAAAAWPGERAEHLAIFSRWYHAHSRAGEWFPFSTREGLPYRKLARGISRLAAKRRDLQSV